VTRATLIEAAERICFVLLCLAIVIFGVLAAGLDGIRP
jgi:hypothetical protein